MVPKICKRGARAKTTKPAIGALALAAVAIGGAACKRAPREGDDAVITSGRWGGLDVRLVSPPGAPAKGGRALVMLHGFGGSPSTGSFRRPPGIAAVRQHMRVFLPAGPEAYSGGRAWWGGDGEYWPPHAAGDEQGDALGTDPPLAAARSAVQALLRDIQREFAPDDLVLAGYSQGGMLAMDVALARDPPVERVAILSSTMLAASLPGLRGPGVDPPVFVIHGRNDQVVPFASGERLKRLLEGHGHQVIWRPFDGGHQWPPRPIFDELLDFLAASAPRSSP
jgi:phospholipase/carboxylesterase